MSTSESFSHLPSNPQLPSLGERLRDYVHDTADILAVGAVSLIAIGAGYSHLENELLRPPTSQEILNHTTYYGGPMNNDIARSIGGMPRTGMLGTGTAVPASLGITELPSWDSSKAISVIVGTK